MKNLKILILLILLGSLLISCNKEKIENNVNKANEDDISFILSEINNNDGSELRACNWCKKLKKWIKDHSGSTLFKNCKGNGGCGPCPGACLKFRTTNTNGDSEAYFLTLEDADGLLTALEVSNGYELYSLTLIQNSSTNEYKLLFEFDSQNNFVTMDSVFVIQEDTYLGTSSTNLNDFNNIIGQSGRLVAIGHDYPVYLNSQTGLYETIVDFYID